MTHIPPPSNCFKGTVDVIANEPLLKERMTYFQQYPLNHYRSKKYEYPRFLS